MHQRQHDQRERGNAHRQEHDAVSRSTAHPQSRIDDERADAGDKSDRDQDVCRQAARKREASSLENNWAVFEEELEQSFQHGSDGEILYLRGCTQRRWLHLQQRWCRLFS
jgi:hypothetical protein